MKKIFNMLMATAIALCTFTACEDVPMPFNNPLDYQENETDTSIPPEGDGTFENPFNVSAVLQYINGLEPGVESDKDVYVKGVVLSVKESFSTKYGNATFTMSDDDEGTNSFTFFRGLYFGNKKYSNTEDVNVVEGDKVVVCGRVMNYGGNTPETAQGKAFIVTINDKTVKPKETTNAEPKGTGTQADPYNPAGAAAAVKNLTWTSNDTYETTGDVYVIGKISRIAEKGTFTDGGTYGNASFYISEDGTESGEFYCFRILYLGNKKFARGQTDIKVGDEVIVCGQLMNYRGNTPETVAGKAYLYSLNGTTEGSSGGSGEAGAPSGNGTLSSPYNVAAACAAVANLTWTSNDTYDTTDEVYVKGKISKIADNGSYSQSGSYGNASFYIKDDGADTEFYCYRLLYLGNKKYESGQTDIKVGDEVIIHGKLMNYRGNTPETVANQTYLYSLNGKTEGGSSGSDTPGGGSTVTDGNITKTVSGTTVTLTVNNVEAGASVTIDLNAQGWADKAAPTTITLEDGTKIDFAKAGGTTAPVFYAATKGVRVYAKNTITIAGSKAVAKVVMTCDSYNGTDYVGNSTLTGTTSGNTFTVINEHSEDKGGVQLRVQTITIYYVK